MSLLDEIPGYRQAAEDEMRIRHAAFLPITEDIGGFAVAQMSLRQYLLLRNLQSPLLFGGTPLPHDLVRFLWILSPQFTPRFSLAKWRFLRRCRKFMPPAIRLYHSERKAVRFMARYQRALIAAAELVQGIRQYIADTFMDKPLGVESHGEDKLYFADAICICTAFAREYGWSESAILDMPLKRVFQYLNEMKRARLGDKAKLFNPSDRKITEWLESKNNPRHN
jgi:hypothetical protein